MKVSKYIYYSKFKRRQNEFINFKYKKKSINHRIKINKKSLSNKIKRLANIFIAIILLIIAIFFIIFRFKVFKNAKNPKNLNTFKEHNKENDTYINPQILFNFSYSQHLEDLILNVFFMI